MHSNYAAKDNLLHVSIESHTHLPWSRLKIYQTQAPVGQKIPQAHGRLTKLLFWQLFKEGNLRNWRLSVYQKQQLVLRVTVNHVQFSAMMLDALKKKKKKVAAIGQTER